MSMECNQYYNPFINYYIKKQNSNGQTVLEKMKQTITKQIEITMPDTSKPFYIITDAFNTGIGAALLQQHPTENKMKLISANSRLFTPIETRLSTLIRECSAIIFALTEYEFLLTGSEHPIILFSGHKPIIYLVTQKNKPNHIVYRFQLILMKFPNLHIIWTEGKNLALPDLLSRTINEEQFTKTRDITVEIPENIEFYFAKTPFGNNIECQYSICYNNVEKTDQTHYPFLTNIHNNFFEIDIDKNEYQPISYEKFKNETKTNLIPKYKPKIKNWNSPIIEKDDLIISKKQNGPYIKHHDDDYLRLLNNVQASKQQSDNVKITDIFYDENTKITNSLLKKTQILDPVLQKVKIWKMHNNKPHSVTPKIRGKKGLFEYYGKFKSVVIDENTSLMTMLIAVKKKSLIRICLPLTLLL